MMRGHPLGTQATIIGAVTEQHPGTAVLACTALGGTRIVDLLARRTTAADPLNSGNSSRTDDFVRVGLVVYGSLDTLSGGYLYDRMLVRQFLLAGHQVVLLSLAWRDYAKHLGDKFRTAPGSAALPVPRSIS